MHPYTPRAPRDVRSHPRTGPQPHSEPGASTLEYVLLAAAVAAVLAAVLLGIGSIVKDAIDHANDCYTSRGTSTNCPTPAP